MKTLSHLPITALFDTGMVILFFLLLNQAKSVSFDVPKNKLFTGAQLVYEKQGKYYYAYTQAEYRGQQSIDYLTDCQQQIECRLAKAQHGNAYILLPEYLFSEIAKLTFSAFQTGACNNIKYFITLSGKLDYLKITQENKCMKKLPGVQNLEK